VAWGLFWHQQDMKYFTFWNSVVVSAEGQRTLFLYTWAQKILKTKKRAWKTYHNVLVGNMQHNCGIVQFLNFWQHQKLFSSQKCPVWLTCTYSQGKEIWNNTSTFPYAIMAHTGTPFYWQIVNITSDGKRWKKSKDEEEKEEEEKRKKKCKWKEKERKGKKSDLNLESLAR